MGLEYAFGDLLYDIGKWFLAGIVIAAGITVLVPTSFIETHLGGGILPMIIMLVIAVPMYVCATASTPIAAALALKGISPGAALVFLLAGPATNAASLAVISRLLGKKATGIYLAAIICCSLAMGIMANYVYSLLGMDITGWISQSSGEHHSLLSQIFAVILLALIIKPFLQQLFSNKKTCACGDPAHGKLEHRQ